MSNLLNFAKNELRLLRNMNGKPDKMQDAIEKNVLDMVERFSAEGHSGSSAGYTISILEKVLRFEPVTPLTGADEEWCLLDNDDRCYEQNKRCPRVFRRRDGTAYDIQALVFRDPDGSCWTGADSHQDITFPYRPETKIVDRQPE